MEEVSTGHSTWSVLSKGLDTLVFMCTGEAISRCTCIENVSGVAYGQSLVRCQKTRVPVPVLLCFLWHLDMFLLSHHQPLGIQKRIGLSLIWGATYRLDVRTEQGWTPRKGREWEGNRSPQWTESTENWRARGGCPGKGPWRRGRN